MALAQDRDHFVLGPRQFEFDNDKGAVLCAYAIYVDVQAETAFCKVERTPVDDAIDRAVLNMEDFIVANSSLHPTRAALEEFRRNAAASYVRDATARGRLCHSPEIEAFRHQEPEKIRTGVAALLAVPREPVMNPCL